MICLKVKIADNLDRPDYFCSSIDGARTLALILDQSSYIEAYAILINGFEVDQKSLGLSGTSKWKPLEKHYLASQKE